MDLLNDAYPFVKRPTVGIQQIPMMIRRLE